MLEGQIRTSLLLGLLGTVTASCAYRFTNQHAAPPTSIRTIAVEAVYDTSQEVLPHDILWSELQRAFARDGRLKLVANEPGADALVRAHIKKAEISPSGTLVTLSRLEDRKDPEPFEGGPPPSPLEYRPLAQAGRYMSTIRMVLGVRVEVIDLSNGKSLITRDYVLGEGFNSIAGQFSVRANNFLRAEEAQQTHFRRIAQRLSSRVLQALFVRPL